MKLLREGGARQATLRLLGRDGRRLVAKEFFRSPLPYRRWLAPLLLDREEAALRRLTLVDQVPQVLERPHPACLLLEYRSGTPLEQIAAGELPEEALEQALELLRQLHQAGVVHGDIGHDFNARLGRETNFLWCPEHGWTLLDFGGSLCGQGTFPWDRWLRRLMKAHDQLFLTKLLLTHFPQIEEHPYLEFPARLDYSYWKWWKRLGKL